MALKAPSPEGSSCSVSPTLRCRAARASSVRMTAAWPPIFSTFRAIMGSSARWERFYHRVDRLGDVPHAAPMAVYTDITDDELATLLADFDLGTATSFKGIAEGVENSNFLLETETGRYFLTVYEKRVREEDLPFFLGLMRWLEEHGFPSARPIADRQGRMLKAVRGKPAA